MEGHCSPVTRTNTFFLFFSHLSAFDLNQNCRNKYSHYLYMKAEAMNTRKKRSIFLFNKYYFPTILYRNVLLQVVSEIPKGGGNITNS